MEINAKNKKIVFTCLWILSIGIFVIYGGHSYVIDEDTVSYSVMNYNQGVMPGYQLFLLLIRSIFQNKFLFTIVSIIQGILAAVSLMCFTKYIDKICNLSVPAVIITYFCGMIPFLVEFPRYITSQAILTEGLSMPITYLLVLTLLKALIEDDLKYIFISYLVSMLSYLVRPQFLISIVFVSTVMIWMILRRKKITFLRVCAAGFSGILCAGLVILFVLKLYAGYIAYLSPKLVAYDKTIDKPAYEGELDQIVNVNISEEVAQAESNSEETKSGKNTSQFTTLLIIRGFFIAEDNDTELFNNDDRELFQDIMINLHSEDMLWCDMEKPLFESWVGMVQDRIATVAVESINENSYFEGDSFAKAANMGAKIIFHNIGDLIIVFLRLWFPALMAATFIQKPSIYAICVCMTFLINLFIIACLWLRRKSNNNVDVMLRFSYLATLVYTILVSAVHIPLQRYLIYFQGLLYISIFVVIRQVWIEKYKNNQSE